MGVPHCTDNASGTIRRKKKLPISNASVNCIAGHFLKIKNVLAYFSFSIHFMTSKMLEQRSRKVKELPKVTCTRKSQNITLTSDDFQLKAFSHTLLPIQIL